jgi:hypothetical protein
MDDLQIVWSWLNGLVRRVTIGTLLFLFFSIISLLLVLSSAIRERDLRHLGDYSQLHARFSDEFLAVASLAADLSGTRARAMQPVEPLRRALADAGSFDLPDMQCANTWLHGLRDLQSVPDDLAGGCDMEGDTCIIRHERIILSDLIAFERGIAAVQDALPALERVCFQDNAPPAVCTYYRAHREKEIAGLSTFVGRHYRQTLAPADRALLDVRVDREICPSQNTLLSAAPRLVAAIDPTARPRTLSDFEKLGESISTRRVAIQSEDTRVSSAPAGGLLTVLVPKDVSLPVLQLCGFLAVLYGFLNIRRLDRLTSSTELGDERKIYALYPVASPGFTSVVFGGAAEGEPISSRPTRLASLLTDTLFSWIPVGALLTSVGALVGAALLWASDSGVFSTPSITIAALLTLLQTIATLALQRERQAVRDRFNQWTAAPENPATDNQGD